MPAESDASRDLRRTMGWTCVLALPVGLIGLAAGESQLWSWVFTYAMLGPTALASLHIHYARFLTPDQKAAWRHGLLSFWKSQKGLFVAWEYLFSSDLTRADFRGVKK